MSSLVEIKNRQALTSSVQVAEKFGKRPDNVLRDIKNTIKDLNSGDLNFEGTNPQFLEYEYEDSQGKKRPMFLMNRDAFILIVMGFTGEKALQFKMEYLGAFNKMEAAIQRQHNEDWREARLSGKQARRELTDVIQRFVEYAQAQGSQNAGHYYSNITKMTYKCLALLEKGAKVTQNFRDLLDSSSIAFLSTAELIAEDAIQRGMDEGMPYKQIYEYAKNKVEAFAPSVLPRLARNKPTLIAS